MAIELAASIAAFDRRRGRLGHARLAFGDVAAALSPGVSGAGAAGRPAAGSRPVALAICSEIAARLSLSACSRDSSASSASRRCGLRRLQFGEARLGLGARGGDFALLDGDRVARVLRSRARDRRHPLDRGARFVAQPLDPAGDRVVVVLDLAQVFGRAR